jgi:aminoglycoside phosphotransferase (APT) family kinase protein
MPIPPAPTPDQFDQIAKAIDPEATVISTRKLLGGLGCRMDVLEMRLADGTAHKVVTRQYWVKNDPTTDKRPKGESAILEALAANNVPVPLPVLKEDVASNIFGRPGLVISYIDGKPNLLPPDLQDWARQLGVALAKIHATTVPDELKSVPRSQIESLNKWLSTDEPPEGFAKHELGPDLWRTMKTLWPNVDTSAHQIVHTDFWPGNTLWKDQTLLAIVDWELPSLGVPSSDVGYFLSDAVYAGYNVEETFINAYEKAAGKPVQDLLFWKMAAAAMPLPDVGPWAQGYNELGMRKMNADEIRRAHSKHINKLLNEFNSDD